MAGLAANERKKEHSKCEELMAAAQKKYREKKANKSKRKSVSQGTKTLQELEQDLQEIYMHKRNLEKVIDIDTKERLNVVESSVDFLKLALESFANALSTSDLGDKINMTKYVYKMVSLWYTGKAEANAVIGSVHRKIPSFRFAPLIYQLFSRLGQPSKASSSQLSSNEKDNEDFQDILRQIVIRICVDHPYHALVPLIALSNGNKIGSGVSGRQSSTYLDNVGDSKVEATKEVLNKVRETGPSYLTDLIHSYECICNAYIDLAMAPTQQFHTQRSKYIPLSVMDTKQTTSLEKALKSGRNSLPCPPCILTKPPQLRPLGDYGEGVEDPIGSERILGFERNFCLTETGLHRPKIVVCLGTKGGRYRQLVKGEDDIRQDAVMQQVFGTVNDLLKRHSARDKHNNFTMASSSAKDQLSGELKIATYNIVPLSPASGVLEWVDNTLPFGDYLFDSGRGKKVGAHSKYYPGEWGQAQCRTHYRNAPSGEKRSAYDEVCRHFSPAFRYFFLERFSYSIEAWHTARMRYTRSCATSSIVGHVLGIGDRHAQNILISEKTGEVVHIDFGIVFEQGKCLATPETIPFRLTRDIVDGMGPCGTDGPFSRAAEATTLVLRENASSLLTILSAVVSDPLYKWSVSPLKARERQRNYEDTDNNVTIDGEMSEDHAEIENSNDEGSRAISKIHQKLQGYEDGTSGESMSVEGQVQFLINEARDPDNLCVLFAGWSPWL